MPNIFEAIDAASTIATTYTLQVGSKLQGTLNVVGDRDFYRLNATAGQTYTLALVGTGANDVRNPWLRLYGSDGSTVLAADDNGLPNLNSIITYTAAATGAIYVAVAAVDDVQTGQYGLSVASGSKAIVDVQMGAGLIDADSTSNRYSWAATNATPATVSIGFRATDDGAQPNFSQFSAQQRAAVQAIAANFSDVCGLTFNFVNPTDVTDNATILMSNYNNPDGSGGHSEYPGSTAFNAAAGDIHINLAGSSSTTTVVAGNFSYFTLMHELGHAVGLSHPGLYNEGPGVSLTYADDARFVTDTTQFTTMSYFDESNLTASWSRNNDTLMMYDIYALQQIYGANNATRSAGSIYGFNSNVGGIYDFNINPTPTLCIWDGGGVDTIDTRGYSYDQLISLVSGSFSNIGGLFGNVSIALGTVIENAFGGTGNDRIDLSSDNVSNYVDGYSGSDTVYVSYSYGSGYTVQPGSIASSLAIDGSAGYDTLQNIDFVHFADGVTVSTASLAAGASPPKIYLLSTNYYLAGYGSSPSAGGWTNNTTYHREVADVNGDGKADIIGFGSSGVIVSLADFGGFIGGIFRSASTELAAFGSGAAGGGWSSDIVTPRRLADVNGDDMADIVGFAGSGVQISLATGDGHFGAIRNDLAAFGAATGGWTSDNLYPREFGDVNGDGRADIFGFGSETTKISFAV